MRARTQRLGRAASAFAFGAFFVLPSLDAALARCSVGRFLYKFGAESSTSMTAESGQHCNIKLWEGSGTIIKSITTAARPAKGTLTPQNSVNVAYRSRAGFQGHDSFVIAINGTKNGVRGTARVVVNVSVEAGGATSPAAATSTRSANGRTTRQGGIPNALQVQCLQQVGASIDPATKKYIFYATERDMMSRTDMYRLCLAGGDRRKAKSIAVRELPSNPGGSVPQRN